MLLISKKSSFEPSGIVQVGLCQIWSETPEDCFPCVAAHIYVRNELKYPYHLGKSTFVFKGIR